MRNSGWTRSKLRRSPSCPLNLVRDLEFYYNRVGNLKRDIKTRNKRFTQTLFFFFPSFFSTTKVSHFYEDTRIICSSFGIINVVSEFMRILLCVSAYLPAIQTIKKKKKTRKKQSSFLWLKLRIFQSCLINQLWELELKKRKNADAYNYNYFSYNNNSRSDRIWRKKKKNLHTTLHFYPVSSCCKQEKNLPKLLSVIWLI